MKRCRISHDGLKKKCSQMVTYLFLYYYYILRLTSVYEERILITDEIVCRAKETIKGGYIFYSKTFCVMITVLEKL